MTEIRPPFDTRVFIQERGQAVEPTLRALLAKPEALDVLPDLTRQAPVVSELQAWATQYDIPLVSSGECHPFALMVPFSDLFTMCPPRVLELLDEENVLLRDGTDENDMVTVGDIVAAMQIAQDEAKEIDDLRSIMREADRLMNTHFPDLGAPTESTQLILLYQRETDHIAGYQGKINGVHVVFLHAPMKSPSLSHNPWRSRAYIHPTYDNYQYILSALIEERAHQAHAQHVEQPAFWYPFSRDEETLTDKKRPYSYRELVDIQRSNDYIDVSITGVKSSDLIMTNGLIEALAHAVTLSCMLGFAQEVAASTDRRRIKQDVGKMLGELIANEPEYGIAFHLMHNAQRQGMSLQRLVQLILQADLQKFYKMDPASPDMQALIADPSLLQSYTA